LINVSRCDAVLSLIEFSIDWHETVRQAIEILVKMLDIQTCDVLIV